MSPNQIEILKQAAGQLGRPSYGDRMMMQRDMTYLLRTGFIERAMEDDQPTAYATPMGEEALRNELAKP